MRGGTISQIISSHNPDFPVGTFVVCTGNWQEFAAIPVKEVTKIPNNPKIPLTKWLGILGITGLTAYFGLTQVGSPKKGETLVVSGAAGATGSVVGQIGKILGLRVVGIAGDTEKCEWLRDKLNFDAVINYKTTDDFDADLKKACPNGVDIYFDNVGGSILNSVLAKINFRARIVICGAISQYNSPETIGPSNYLSLLINRAKMEGFIVFDFVKDYPTAQRELAGWFLQGKLQGMEHVEEGLEKAPAVINYLFEGKNRGKLMIKISDPELKSNL